jgi:hypothetical protein
MSLCVFCGTAGSSEEDVFARWITAVVGGGPFTLRRKHGRTKTNLRDIRLTSRAPCKRCNNTWMSVFEQTAKPLLIPVIKDTPTVWASDAEQRLVARWAFKTALMIDRANRPHQHTVPEEVFRYLFSYHKPPPSTTILLARYKPEPGEDFFLAWAGSSWMAAHRPDGEDLKGYRITFSVGHAIFQIYGHLPVDTDDLVYEREIALGDRPIEDAMRPLWPLRFAPHAWPPRGAKFATSGLELLEQSGP